MRRIFKNHSGFADVVFVFLLSCEILFLQLNENLKIVLVKAKNDFTKYMCY